MVEHHLADSELGRMQLRKVRKSHLLGYLNERAVADTTRRNHVGFLKRLFAFCPRCGTRGAAIRASIENSQRSGDTKVS